MKKKFKKITAVLCTVAAMCTLLTAPVMAALEAVTYTQDTIDEFDGFDFELWIDNQKDNAALTLTGGGTFEGYWENAFALFRTGKKLGSAATYTEYGNGLFLYPLSFTRSSIFG
jgi:hypothetical protein